MVDCNPKSIMCLWLLDCWSLGLFFIYFLNVPFIKFQFSFIVILLHAGTYSGTKRCASQDHGAT